MELQIRGLAELNRRLRQVTRDAPAAGLTALREEAEVEMTEAKRRTPVDTGALRASGHVETKPAQGEVVLRFGGPAVNYALPVHENLEAFHRVGQAKYLESVLLESIPHLAERVAARMRQILGS